ncbi:MAG: hypothetical protein M1540_03745 [Candidatus Bathyarchaeota archaeon]|nr:hypothetical protein [Candidatus Bathyarchaeota archaeon]
MSDSLNQDAILSSTILKACGTCRHPRGAHTQDRYCTVKGCNCQKFTE